MKKILLSLFLIVSLQNFTFAIKSAHIQFCNESNCLTTPLYLNFNTPKYLTYTQNVWLANTGDGDALLLNPKFNPDIYQFTTNESTACGYLIESHSSCYMSINFRSADVASGSVQYVIPYITKGISWWGSNYYIKLNYISY